MGLLDHVRRSRAGRDKVPDTPTVEMLRTNGVLVLPADVTRFAVVEHLRHWSPDLGGTGERYLTFDVYELHGPVGYDEAVWLRAELPPEYPQAYVLTQWGDPGGDGTVSWIGYDSLLGLARRLCGGARPALDGEPWEELGGQSPDPWVFAPRGLSPEEARELLAPHLPGLHIGLHDELTGEYQLDADGCLMWCDPVSPTIYPLVREQSWFTSRADTVEYQFVSDPETEGPQRVERAAGVLAAATGGVVLDEDGFPWVGQRGV